jgi:hypothetical protein
MPITKKEKVEILQKLGYYNKKFGREATRLGFTRDEYYEIWKETFRLWEEEDKAFTLEEIVEKIRELRVGKEHEPFELIIRSYMSPNITSPWSFKNMFHFEKWARQVLKLSSVEVDSTGRLIKDFEEEDVFKYMLYDIRELVGGSSTKKDSNALKSVRKIQGDFFTYKVRQVHVQHNNCGLECIRHLLGVNDSFLSMRKLINKDNWREDGSLLSFNDLYTVYNKLKKDDKKLYIHAVNGNRKVDDADHHILCYKKHYYVILSAEERPFETEDKVKRGVIYWDIETRPTEQYCMIGDTKSYYLRDTILNAHVRKYKSNEYEHLYFKTNDKSSCRQFLEWLQQEGRDNRYYYLYAHNGGNFDVYFLLMNFNEEEAGKYIPTLRGTTVIKLEYGNNVFLDSYCFLTKSLKKLSEDFKVKQAKLQSFIVNGEQLTNEQLCFYKPELTFDEFLQLEHTEPEYWELYKQYCYMDCVALQHIWDSFNDSIEKLIDIYVKESPHRKRDLLTKCMLRQSCTIGGHAQKILDALNGVKTKKSYDYQNFEKFLGNISEFETDKIKEKHDFIMNNFKRGGISHCNKKGMHTEGVMSVDICSQYPASMIHMKIPTGYSCFTTEYDPPSLGCHGFYILRNLKFETAYKFKPVCEVLASGVLNWNTDNTIERLALDSYMIEYLKEHYGLVSFDVERGLVSNYEIEGSKLFGSFVNPLFKEKALQDKYKDSKEKTLHDKYNPAYRETIKLYLNSITGKLVMNREKYSSLVCCSDEQEGEKKNINGVSYSVQTKENLNNWIVAGVMVYSYSKRLLFEYIRNMPNNSNDIIHVETDSMYFPISCEETFNKNIANYAGEYPIKYGNELGNIKVEKRDTDTCYFLNKKVYTIGGNYIWKGIPKRTLLEDGTERVILNKEMYEKVYNKTEYTQLMDGSWEITPPITAEFMTMSRQLFGQTKISGHRQIRTLNSTYDYQKY